MKSFNRLRQLNRVVSELIKSKKMKNVVVADIATDHGYLAELLSRNDKISCIYATDISQKCLDKTNDLINKCGLNKIVTRLGDGLEPIETVDISILAGIGGYEIINIISNQNITKTGENKCTNFVLQPSKNEVELRRFLIEKNYEIEEDFIVKSGGKFYPIIVANLKKKCTVDNSIFNLYFGRTNDTKNQDFLDYLVALMEDYKFLNNMDEDYIKNNEDLMLKFEIISLAKSLINNKGD